MLSVIRENKIQSNLCSTTENLERCDGGLRRSGYFKQSLQDRPLITVITVVYNGYIHLEQTIQSVVNQTYSNIEYIIIDGGSTDVTLDIIHKYQNKIDYWISEPDNGIADAMNKGLSFSTGDYILFMNADDYLINNDCLKNAVEQVNNSDIILFNILYGVNLKELSPRGFNFWMNFKTGVFHQAVLCHRNVFNMIGGFDTDFIIVLDYDFFLRAYRSGVTVHKNPSVLSVMRDTGISSRKDVKSVLQRFAEERMVHKKNCLGIMMSWLYKVYWFLYIGYKKITF